MRHYISLIIGCAAAAISVGAQAQPTPLPTYTPAYEPTSVDERGMWMESDEFERKLRDSPLLIRDEDLNSYVKRVLCHTVGEERCKAVRIYILEIPAFNAEMHPNGAMIIWSGLLLRVRNEAELGAILGHEFGHFELRHTLRAFKRQRGATDALAWLSVLGSANRNIGLIQLSIVGSFYKFTRDQEREADLMALKYLAASPYPTQPAADVWKEAMGEADATAVGRGRKPRQHYTAGFFDSHPTDLNRAIYMADAAAKLNHSGDLAVEGHRKAIAKYLPRFLADQIELNDFGGSEYVLSGLSASSGWTGELLFARGELYRLRGNPRDLVSAAQFYGQAIAAGYTAPNAHRNLGLALLRTGQVTEGKQALEEYLKLDPNASDAKAIAALMSN